MTQAQMGVSCRPVLRVRMKRLSKANREKAEIVLAHAAAVQTIFWDLCGELENLLGCEVHSSQDLELASIDDLIRDGE